MYFIGKIVVPLHFQLKKMTFGNYKTIITLHAICAMRRRSKLRDLCGGMAVFERF